MTAQAEEKELAAKFIRLRLAHHPLPDDLALRGGDSATALGQAEREARGLLNRR